MQNVIRSMKIGSISLKNNLFLAPLESYTNVALRKNIHPYGPGLTFTEMIPANALSKDRNYCKDFLYKDKSEGFVAYQLGGSSKGQFIKSVRNIKEDADIININLGCPVDKVINQGVGCSLLQRKSIVYQTIKALKKEFNIPVTIKVRTGFKIPSHFDYDKLYSIGCDAMFIHARTCNQRYRDGINYQFLKEAKEKAQFPIIGNGDLNNLDSINKMYQLTGVDGFMIGRAALHNPKIFEDILEGNNHKEWAITMPNKEKAKFLEMYYKDLNTYNIKNSFTKSKDLSMYLFAFVDGAKKIREDIAKIKEWNKLIEYSENI